MTKPLPITKYNYPYLLCYGGWFYWHMTPDRRFFASQNVVDPQNDKIGPFKSLRALKDHIDNLPETTCPS